LSVLWQYTKPSRAFGRIGSAYSKQGDLANAIKFYSKSLTEHRTPDILTKLREAEKAKAETDRQAYIDPEKAEAAREEGNAQFKVGWLSISNHHSALTRTRPDSSQMPSSRIRKRRSVTHPTPRRTTTELRRTPSS
jgi:stress-induced-phosphoprotein 1